MKLLTLLLVVKKVFSLDLINAKTLGGWNFQDVVTHLYQSGYNGGYNTPGDARRFQVDQQPPITQQQPQQPNFGVPNFPNDVRQSNHTCCPKANCPNPCISPAVLPYYPIPPIPIVPMRAYYEKVVHDHPPINKINEILKKRRKKYRSDDSEESSDEDYTSYDEESESSKEDLEW